MKHIHLSMLARLAGLSVLATTVIPTGFSSGAQAQVGETGEVSTRSDVRMSVEGAPGTSTKKVDAIAAVLGGPLAEVKRCYGELVKEHPEVVGTLAVEILLPADKAPTKISAPGAVKALKPMQRCIDKAFAKLDVKDLPRPAKASVLLELTNSAASSVGNVREEQAQAAQVNVEDKGGGTFASHGASLSGEVVFDVEGKGPSAQDTISRVHNGVRDALPGLFDCRRRASKKASPEGDLVFEVKLRPSEKPSFEVKSTTVAAERAPTCSTSALKRGATKGGSGIARVTIHFQGQSVQAAAE